MQPWCYGNITIYDVISVSCTHSGTPKVWTTACILCVQCYIVTMNRPRTIVYFVNNSVLLKCHGALVVYWCCRMIQILSYASMAKKLTTQICVPVVFPLKSKIITQDPDEMARSLWRKRFWLIPTRSTHPSRRRIKMGTHNVIWNINIHINL